MEVQKSIFLKSASLVTGLTKVWVGVNDTVTELATTDASLPSGLIAIWKGSTNTIPDGWALWDGQNSTPDLRDKFVLGAGNSYAVDSTGGEETHKLTTSELPEHSHTITGIGQGSSQGVRAVVIGTGFYDRTASTNPTGDGSAHNNMPPYYALHFIMKT